MSLSIKSMALKYAALGFSIIPLCPGDHSCMSDTHIATCRSPGKRPLIKEWQNAEVPSEQQVEEWFRRWPSANIGLVLGSRSGFVALDVDGQFGQDKLLEISAGNHLSDAWQFSTPGGVCVMFTLPPKGETAGNSVSATLILTIFIRN